MYRFDFALIFTTDLWFYLRNASLTVISNETCLQIFTSGYLNTIFKPEKLNARLSFLITVKEATRQRKEAKLIKQLDKQRQQEAAETEKLEEQQNKNGKATVLSCAAVCSSARTPVKRQM